MPMARLFKSYLQSDFGRGHKDFEAVVLDGGDLCHWRRDNSAPGKPWKHSQCIIKGRAASLAPSSKVILDVELTGTSRSSFHCSTNEGRSNSGTCGTTTPMPETLGLAAGVLPHLGDASWARHQLSKAISDRDLMAILKL